MGSGPSTPYDVVVKLNSLSSLKNGVDITLPGIVDPKAKQAMIAKLEKDEDGSKTIVGLLGTYNAGKTFVLNKISNYSCPSGVTVATEGLSFKVVKNSQREFVVIDTAGLNSPVELVNDKDLTPLADRKSADQFLQSLVFQLGDIFIVVVNHISFKEQENLHQIVSKLTQPNQVHHKCPFIILVHNWKECKRKSDMDYLFKNQIQKLYTSGKEEFADELKWYNNNHTRHVTLGNDEKMAVINEKTIKLIISWIDAYKAETTRKGSLLIGLKKSAKNVLVDFVQEPGEVEIDLKTLTLKVHFKELKPFSFSVDNGVQLSGNIRFLEFRSAKGKRIILEMPGADIVPTRLPEGISISYTLTKDVRNIFDEFKEAPPDNKNECGLITNVGAAPLTYLVNVEAHLYDTDKAEFKNVKGYFIINIPFRTIANATNEVY